MRYLPRELTVQLMLDDFQKNYPNEKCSRASYAAVMHSMNVSLKMPKSDTCELCDTMKNKEKNEQLTESDKEVMENHKQMAQKERKELEKDAQHPHGVEKAVYSIDMQKVLLLPIMPKIKESHFTSRLVVFNETFAPVKSGSVPETAYCIVWHEAIYGRTADGVVSAIYSLISELQEVKEFVLWCDNCSAQNKNWILFSALVCIVNQSWGPNSITLKYLTKGHTHMTADAIHGCIEKKIRNQDAVEDLRDLVTLMQNCRKNTRVKVLDTKDFFLWKNEKAPKKGPEKDSILLNRIVQVTFQKGQKDLCYKYDFDDTLQRFDFLKQKSKRMKGLPENVKGPRGISKAKKQGILRLSIHISDERKTQFWIDLPVNEESPDLTTCFEGCQSDDI